MPDVTITFGGDLSALNKQIADMAKGGERAAKAVGKPMEKLPGGQESGAVAGEHGEWVGACAECR